MERAARPPVDKQAVLSLEVSRPLFQSKRDSDHQERVRAKIVLNAMMNLLLECSNGIETSIIATKSLLSCKQQEILS
jgi:hypothetical protein